MAKHPAKAHEPELAALVKEIVRDSETLIGQQLDLLRAEVRRELGEARGAAVMIGAGAGLVATGGVLTVLMAVHGLQRATRLPLWGCYGLVGGLLGAAGAGLLAAGGREAAGVHLIPPPETMGALRENLEWIKEQATQEAT